MFSFLSLLCLLCCRAHADVYSNDGEATITIDSGGKAQAKSQKLIRRAAKVHSDVGEAVITIDSGGGAQAKNQKLISRGAKVQQHDMDEDVEAQTQEMPTNSRTGEACPAHCVSCTTKISCHKSFKRGGPGLPDQHFTCQPRDYCNECEWEPKPGSNHTRSGGRKGGYYNPGEVCQTSCSTYMCTTPGWARKIGAANVKNPEQGSGYEANCCEACASGHSWAGYSSAGFTRSGSRLCPSGLAPTSEHSYKDPQEQGCCEMTPYYWVDDACHSEDQFGGDKQKDDVVGKYRIGKEKWGTGVTCCDADGAKCHTVRKYSSVRSNDLTFDESRAICAFASKRLCTKTELLSEMCCTTNGGRLDNSAVWTSTPQASPTEASPTMASPTEASPKEASPAEAPTTPCNRRRNNDPSTYKSAQVRRRAAGYCGAGRRRRATGSTKTRRRRRR